MFVCVLQGDEPIRIKIIYVDKGGILGTNTSLASKNVIAEVS